MVFFKKKQKQYFNLYFLENSHIPVRSNLERFDIFEVDNYISQVTIR